MKTICIGIQARSTSKRFPGKIHELIGDKSVLEHVINRCKSSANYLNAHQHKNNFVVKVCLLIPFGDQASIGATVPIIEGDEDDVLSRYVEMAKEFDADYIVRITADCPLIPPPIITAHINKCVKNNLDYMSNVMEPRVSIDGHDCEVISRSLMNWLDFNAKNREHVTLELHESPPEWARIGRVVGYCDLSHIKLSLDTREDLEEIRYHYYNLQEALDYEGVHRF